MKRIAILDPEQPPARLAAQEYDPQAIICPYPHIDALIDAFSRHEADYALLPIYNTRAGERKQFFRFFDRIRTGYWIDNLVMQSCLSLGVLDDTDTLDNLEVLVGRPETFNQCEEFIEARLSGVRLLGVTDVALVLDENRDGRKRMGVIGSEEELTARGLRILERDVAPHNRTRYAVLGHALAPVTGYDATALMTGPLDDRVGLLVDILDEFSRRGISLLDLRSENDIKTQKLRIYLEAEGHSDSAAMTEAVAHIESRIIQQQGRMRLLGSFPRVDMRTKYIRSFGFIGTGAMSAWFADRLISEGYEVVLTGRTSALRPEEMIAQVDVVVVCVPISVTAATVRRYGPLIDDGKALILLAGESEETIQSALESTGEGVEVMLVHNLWGPQAATMKDKNAIVVRTPRSGLFCSEFEAFLYKHGADIFHDSPGKHDLLMGVGQKLPTMISTALAVTLEEHGITSDDIASHCTLTSLYPILAMARVHSQNPRTYAEIMSTGGDSRKLVRDFAKNLDKVVRMAETGTIDGLCDLLEQNAAHLSEDFLTARMRQAKAVDEVLGRML
ncbi:MAG: prephenate dehydratase domain-containing protein [Desulfobulbus sp.]